jgi:hypothetical protein
MSTYTDIHVGFITDENFKNVKERKTKYDDAITVGKLRTLFYDHCLVQYHYNNSFNYHILNDPVPCRFCHEVFSNKTLIYYQGQTRFIFPEYLYHYIRHHNIEIDAQLLELISPPALVHPAYLKLNEYGQVAAEY